MEKETSFNAVDCTLSSTSGFLRPAHTWTNISMLVYCSLAFYWASTYFCEVFGKSLFSVIWKLLAIIICRHPEIKDHFKSTITEIGICSPLWALKLEIPYCLNSLHTLHLFSSERALYPSSSSQQCCFTNSPSISLYVGVFKWVKFIIHPVQQQRWGLGKWRWLPGCHCIPCLVLGLWNWGQQRNWPSLLTMLKPTQSKALV